MSSGLELRVEKYLFGDEIPSNGVVANIYALEPAQYANSMRDVVIPIGYGNNFKRVDLKPGHYLVEAVLPSGDIITKDVVATEGQWPQVVLRGKQSAHEWHSWQTLLGNVQSQRGYEASLADSDLPDYDVALIRQPSPTLQSGTPKSSEVWQFLANLLLSKLRTQPSLLGNAESLKPEWRDRQTQLHSFHMNHMGSRTELPRWYALVANPRTARLLTVPSPWFNMNGEVRSELLVTRSSDLSIGTSWIVKDPMFGTVLGYLGNGAYQVGLTVASQDHALELLLGKFESPLGAAVGGYLMVANHQGSKNEYWHDWIANLMKYFKWLPDGAIQYAWLQLKKGKLDDNRDVARQALFEAYDRGLPYYSLGLQWLIDGLTLLGEEDTEATKRLKAVQRLSWSADMSSLFTTLNLGT